MTRFISCCALSIVSCSCRHRSCLLNSEIMQNIPLIAVAPAWIMPAMSFTLPSMFLPLQMNNIPLSGGTFRENMDLNKPERTDFMLNNTKDILTLKELQELLHIGKNTALRLVQEGDIEAFRVGKQWRIPKESVWRFIRRGM